MCSASWNVAGAGLERVPPAVSVQSGLMGVFQDFVVEKFASAWVGDLAWLFHSFPLALKALITSFFKHRNRSYSTQSQTCSARPGALCLSSSFTESELYSLACLVACFRFLNCRVAKTFVGSYEMCFTFFLKLLFFLCI